MPFPAEFSPGSRGGGAIDIYAGRPWASSNVLIVLNLLRLRLGPAAAAEAYDLGSSSPNPRVASGASEPCRRGGSRGGCRLSGRVAVSDGGGVLVFRNEAVPDARRSQDGFAFGGGFEADEAVWNESTDELTESGSAKEGECGEAPAGGRAAGAEPGSAATAAAGCGADADGGPVLRISAYDTPPSGDGRRLARLAIRTGWPNDSVDGDDGLRGELSSNM